MKNTLKLALTASFFCIGLNATHAGDQDTGEAAKRLKDLATVFSDKGEAGFAFLNGPATMGSLSGKGREAEDLNTAGATGYSNDGNAELICVDGKDMFVVHTSQPSLVGKSAVAGENIWRDADGVALVGKARAALSRGNHGGLTSVDYTQFSDTNSDLQNPRQGKRPTENVHLVIADGRYAKGLPEGAFCATEGQLIGKSLDDGDDNRKDSKDAGLNRKNGKDGDPTAPGYTGTGHKRHHKKSHAKKAEAHQADDQKSDTAKAEKPAA